MSISSKLFYANLTDSSSSSSFHASRRILINPDVLKNFKVLAGDVIAVTSPRNNSIRTNIQNACAVGVAWPSLDTPSDSVYMSLSNLLSANVQVGDKVSIVPLIDGKGNLDLPSPKNIRNAGKITVQEEKNAAESTSIQKNSKCLDWLIQYIHELLVDHKYTFEGQKLKFKYEGKDVCFKVTKISSFEDARDGLSNEFNSLKLEHTPSLWSVVWDSQVTLRKSEVDVKDNMKTIVNSASNEQGYSSVGGLDKQINQIRDLIEIPLTQPELFRHFGLKPPKGILLHGPPGTGKTHLARAVVASTSTSVLVVNGSELSSVYHGETEARLREVFADARRKSPCIVILDEVDALCPRREDGGGEVEKRVVATLLTILDGMEDGEAMNRDERVVVIATTNRPNAIDPALRRPGRFDKEIEIGIPDANARHSILKVMLSRAPHDISDEQLLSIASRTHGYVGADLSATVREAGTIAIKRWIDKSSKTLDDSQQLLLTLEDITAGLALVQPSAMREVFLETPTVRWSDIGGQLYIQQKLRECVEWPLRHPESFARLGVHAPRGVLLYGPPGCSKTLTARALATESGLNFIAVKGPELLNKFVGESERAVREIFRKARAASPSIVFFDEIDALGTSRSGETAEKHAGVLTTLLNEMDGIQELVGVIVVAATNRPEAIDSALMRPGRLDRILYVGPPDLEGRVDILRIRTRHMAIGPDVDLREIANLTEGCSGAELASLCQDAALLTMQENIDAPFVPGVAFAKAASQVRRQITPDIIKKFQQWSTLSGLTSA